MIKQLERIAQVLLQQPAAALKKSTNGEWVLKLTDDKHPFADFTGSEAEALQLLRQYQADIWIHFVLNGRHLDPSG